MANPQRAHEQLLNLGPGPFLLNRCGGLITRQDDFSNPILQCLMQRSNKSLRENRGLKKYLTVPVGSSSLNTLRMKHLYEEGWVDAGPGLAQERVTLRFEQPTNALALKSQEHFLVPNDSTIWTVTKTLPEPDVPFFSTAKLIQATATSFETRSDASSAPVESVEAVFCELEIIRFYYANSNLLAQALFSGDFESDRFDSEVLSVAHEAPHYDETTDTHRFEYQAKFSRADVPYIARMLLGDVARCGARRIHHSLALSNGRHGVGMGHVRTLFPFSGPVTLSVSGRFSDAGGLRRFEVVRIENCSVPFPFRHLSVQSSLEAAPAAGAPDDEPEGPPNVKQTGPGVKGGAMDSLAQAASNSVTVTADPDLKRFTSADFTIEFEPARPASGTSKRTRLIVNGDLVNVSPGSLTGGEATAAQLALLDEVVGGQVSPELASTLASLALLKAMPLVAGRLTYRHVGFEAWQNDEEVIVGVLTKVPTPKSRRYKAFSFKDPDCLVRRQFVVAEVRTVRGIHYVVDIERRSHGNGLPTAKSLLLLSNAERTEIKRAELERFVRACVLEERWAHATFKWRGQPVNHDGPKASTLHRRIEEEIRKQ